MLRLLDVVVEQCLVVLSPRRLVVLLAGQVRVFLGRGCRCR